MGVWQLNYTIQDAKGASSRLTLNFNEDLTVAQVQDLSDQIIALLDPLVTGGIMNAGAVLQLTIPAGVNIPAPASDVEEGARFIFNSVGGFKTAVRIPTFDETKISANSNAVNLVDTDVAAFVTAMVDGLTVTPPGTATGQDYRGVDITSISSARESFQRSRR